MSYISFVSVYIINQFNLEKAQVCFTNVLFSQYLNLLMPVMTNEIKKTKKVNGATEW